MLGSCQGRFLILYSVKVQQLGGNLRLYAYHEQDRKRFADNGPTAYPLVVNGRDTLA
jgi:hypothetical protein